jgi:MFS family permease
MHVSETGLIFITTTLAIAVTQPFSGRWADRVGSRPVASLGLLLQGLGLVVLAFVPLQINPDWLVPELAVIGVGVGLFRSPNHRALFGAVPRNKMGQAGGYQHLPRQLGESIGETGVVTMFSAVVLGSAAVAGIPGNLAPPTPVATPVAVATPAPVTGAAASSGLRPGVVIQPYVPAAQASAAAASKAGTGVSLLDTDTSDDAIVDVPDDSAGDSGDSGLSQAVTSLPADTQMLGYRLMWGLAGVIALGGAVLSWKGRDEEESTEPAPAQTAGEARPYRRATPRTA